MKLDLGSGALYDSNSEFESVDFFSNTANHKINLLKFPWPWEDSSVEELKSSHFLEHIPMVYISEDGSNSIIPNSPSDRDLLCKFMDECYRILKPGGKFKIIVPSGTSSRGFRDPTHRRFFMNDSFYYFNSSWRKERSIDHYLCDCDFDVYISSVIPNHLLSLPQEVINTRCSSEWNFALDWSVVLVSRKPGV